MICLHLFSPLFVLKKLELRAPNTGVPIRGPGKNCYVLKSLTYCDTCVVFIDTNECSEETRKQCEMSKDRLYGNHGFGFSVTDEMWPKPSLQSFVFFPHRLVNL